jgi:CheY-like chemotaxis protein
MIPLARILYIDDSVRDTELALEVLKEANLANEVFVLRDGVEALDYLFCRGQFENQFLERPAVILLDLKMPKVDGVEVLRQIKADPILKLIPVVIMTSSREDNDLTRCYQLGANAYVVKPVEFHEFLDAIRTLGVFWAVLNTPPPNPSELSGKKKGE